MDYTKALKLLALRECLFLRESPGRADEEFKWRKICRWYSKTFFTPLHEVEDLSRYDIIRAFYEEKYSEMSEEELHEAIALAIKPEDEAEAEVAKDEMSLEELIRQTAEEEAQKMQGSDKPEELDENRREKILKDAEETAKLLASLGETIESFQKNKIDISEPKQPVDMLGLGEGDF